MTIRKEKLRDADFGEELEQLTVGEVAKRSLFGAVKLGGKACVVGYKGYKKHSPGVYKVTGRFAEGAGEVYKEVAKNPNVQRKKADLDEFATQMYHAPSKQSIPFLAMLSVGWMGVAWFGAIVLSAIIDFTGISTGVLILMAIGFGVRGFYRFLNNQ